MKSKAAIIIILALITVVACYFLLIHKSFSWNVTYKPNDTEPYGCQLFDSIMSQSLKSGYEVSDADPDTLMSQKKNCDKTILCLRSSLHISHKILKSFVKNGGNVIISTSDLNYDCTTAIGMGTVDLRLYSDIVPQEGKYTVLTYKKDALYNRKNYKVSNCLFQSYLYKQENEEPEEPSYYERKSTVTYDKSNDIIWKSIVKLEDKDNDQNIVMKANYGKGTIVLCAMPLLFTNYGILEGNNSELVMRIMSQCGNRPMIRTSSQSLKEEDSYMMNVNSKGSPSEIMDHVLSDKSLKTAYYLALAGLILFFIFTARRKQRIIPVIKPKSNGQLEFIKQIGDLYHRNHATDSIIEKKYHYLTDKIRKKIRVDINEGFISEEAISAISNYTGLDSFKVEEMLKKLRTYFTSRQAERERIENNKKEEFQKFKSWNVSDDINDMWIKQYTEKKMKSTSREEMVRLINIMNMIDSRL